MTLKEQFRAIIMVIAAMVLYCTSAAADTSGKCGDNLTWSYNSSNGVLTISGKGKMWNYSGFEKLKWGNENFSEVVIENGVTSIGNYAFYGCTGLTSISIPGSVTFIGGWAFEGCSGLTSISIPGSVTFIGGWAFYGCTGLTSISIPSSVTSIDEATFCGCSALTDISLPDSVTLIGNSAFEACSSLTSISIPSGVTSIGANAFRDCSSLTSISIPSGVTSIGTLAFMGCGLSIIKVDEHNRIFNSQNNCNAIINTAKNTLVVGCKNTEIPYSVTSIGDDAFAGCSGLTSISLHNRVTSIGGWAFEGCSGLTSISIPSSVTSIGASAFKGCSGLKSIKELAEIPPECGDDDVFKGVDRQTCKLVVPRETIGLYKLRSPWKYFYNITAGIDAAKADRVSVAAVGGEIAVTGADGDAVVEVYGLNGMLVYRGKSKSVPVPAGVYVVRVADKTVKVAVN